MRRALRFGGAAGVLMAVVVAIALAAATAEATPNKPYTANVHQTLNTPGSFTLTLTNDPHASQSLGSANFTAPAGFVLGAVTGKGGTDASGFNVTVSGNVVQFRAISSQTALGKGATVSADVTVTGGITGCTSATWGVEAKQSNDFSGTPGNDLTLGTSDLTPLGSYDFGPVESVQTAPDSSRIHVPQILVNQATSFDITALDTCGNVDADYTGGAFVLGTGLANATFSALNWSGGSVTASLTPKTVEVGDQFSIQDVPSGISANSVSTGGKTTFDVVQTICAGEGASCTWADPNGKSPITARSTVPGDSNGHASLGLGYKPFKDGVTCGSASPVGDSIYIDPFQYTGPFTIVLTYAKSLAPKGPASGLITCKSTDPAETNWSPTLIPPCGNTPVAPCADAANIQGGALQVTLHLDPNDPHTGGFH
ncbi:MAG TPA: hypothetical protein VJ716_06855 [Gaiellaceae bacterium]|nr:hypothetical protein [Gaiellaceae bacterium]